MSLAREGLRELWRTADHRAFATVVTDGIVEHKQVRSDGFERWLRGRAYTNAGVAPSGQTMSDALAQLQAIAVCDGDTHEAPTRVAGDNSVIWVALAPGRVARIDASGWRAFDAAEVRDAPRFRWGPTMRSLPEPERGGVLRDLQQLINLPDEGWPAVATWLVNALRRATTYPILNLEGEQGSGKSLTARTLVSLIDPAAVPLRRPSRDERDLAIACRGRHVLALDNISRLSADLSDALCTIATGGGFASRKLHSDAEEVVLELLNPVLLNGISGVTARPDLLDRALGVLLRPIPDHLRRAQAELEQAIACARPRLLGALFGALSTAIRRLPETSARWKVLPRMADATLWALAAAPALGIAEEDLHFALFSARNDQAAGLVESDAVGVGLLAMKREEPWVGSATELLRALRKRLGEDGREEGLPKRAAEVGKRVRRLAPELRRLGIDADANTKRIRIAWSADCSLGSSCTSAPARTGEHASTASVLQNSHPDDGELL